MSLDSKNILLLLSPLTVLLIPLIAMQFTNEVDWSLADFAMGAFLLLAASATALFILKSVQQKKYKVLLFIALFILFLLVWAEMAVGIFNTPLAGS